MSVLLVEDNPDRIKRFRRGMIGISITNLTTAKVSIRWLTDHTPRLIFLDYDLHEHGTPIDESGRGSDVSAYLAKHPKRWEHTLVVVHSLNDHGAQKMTLMLQAAGICVTVKPFIWEKPHDLERLVLGIS